MLIKVSQLVKTEYLFVIWTNPHLLFLIWTSAAPLWSRGGFLLILCFWQESLPVYYSFLFHASSFWLEYQLHLKVRNSVGCYPRLPHLIMNISSDGAEVELRELGSFRRLENLKGIHSFCTALMISSLTEGNIVNREISKGMLPSSAFTWRHSISALLRLFRPWWDSICINGSNEIQMFRPVPGVLEA